MGHFSNRVLPLVLVILLVPVTQGCDAIDKLIREIAKTRDAIIAQSEGWQKELEKLQGQITNDIQSTMRNEVKVS